MSCKWKMTKRMLNYCQLSSICFIRAAIQVLAHTNNFQFWLIFRLCYEIKPEFLCIAGSVYCASESSSQRAHRRLESENWTEAWQKVWDSVVCFFLNDYWHLLGCIIVLHVKFLETYFLLKVIFSLFWLAVVVCILLISPLPRFSWAIRVHST